MVPQSPSPFEALRSTAAYYATLLIPRFIPAAPAPPRPPIFLFIMNTSEYIAVIDLLSQARTGDALPHGKKHLRPEAGKMLSMLQTPRLKVSIEGFHTVFTNDDGRLRFLEVLVELARDDVPAAKLAGRKPPPLHAQAPERPARAAPTSAPLPSQPRQQQPPPAARTPSNPTRRPSEPKSAPPPTAPNAQRYTSAEPIEPNSLQMRAQQRREEARRRAEEAASAQKARDEAQKKARDEAARRRVEDERAYREQRRQEERDKAEKKGRSVSDSFATGWNVGRRPSPYFYGAEEMRQREKDKERLRAASNAAAARQPSPKKPGLYAQPRSPPKRDYARGLGGRGGGVDNDLFAGFGGADDRGGHRPGDWHDGEGDGTDDDDILAEEVEARRAELERRRWQNQRGPGGGGGAGGGWGGRYQGPGASADDPFDFSGSPPFGGY